MEKQVESKKWKELHLINLWKIIKYASRIACGINKTNIQRKQTGFKEYVKSSNWKEKGVANI